MTELSRSFVSPTHERAPGPSVDLCLWESRGISILDSRTRRYEVYKNGC